MRRCFTVKGTSYRQAAMAVSGWMQSVRPVVVRKELNLDRAGHSHLSMSRVVLTRGDVELAVSSVPDLLRKSFDRNTRSLPAAERGKHLIEISGMSPDEVKEARRFEDSWDDSAARTR